VENINPSALALLIILLALPLYFLPTIVASLRKSKVTAAVFVVNLFFGWFFGIGWFIALVWAMAAKSRTEDETESRRHEEMMRLIAATKKAE
jgi:hypothetical protein